MPPGPLRLLTMPRIAGLVFNPVSFYYAFEPDGETLAGVLAEVTNTPWGERHTYLAGDDLPQGAARVPADADGPALPLPRARRPARRSPCTSRAPAPTTARRSTRRSTCVAGRSPPRRCCAAAPCGPCRSSTRHALALRLRGVPGHPHPGRKWRHDLRPARRTHRRPRPAAPHLRRLAHRHREAAARRVFTRGADGPRAYVTVNDPRAWPLLLKGSSGMGEAYADGLLGQPGPDRR